MKPSVKAAIFILIAFAISWSALAFAWLHGEHDVSNSNQTNGIFVIAPPIAAILCALLFDKGNRIAALGIAFRPNRWWLGALLFTLAIAAYLFGAAQLFPALGGSHLADSNAIIATFAKMFQVEPDRLGSGPGAAAKLVAVTFLVFTLQTALTEEMGWRGYLYAQWRKMGFWRSSLATGLVWSVWHWPFVILFGLFANSTLVAGIVAFTAGTIAKAPFFTFLRDRSGSVWAPAICHATLNTIGILGVGELFQSGAVVSWGTAIGNLLVYLPPLALLGWIRHKWPDGERGVGA